MNPIHLVILAIMLIYLAFTIFNISDGLSTTMLPNAKRYEIIGIILACIVYTVGLGILISMLLMCI